MTMLPDVRSVTPAELEARCDDLVRWILDIEDLWEARDVQTNVAVAAAAYRKVTRLGQGKIAIVERLADQRLGELILAARERGELADQGRPTNVEGSMFTTLGDLGLDRHDAAEFVAMAEHPDAVSEALAESSDERPATRNAIRQKIRRVPLMVPTGGKGHDGPPHPATYPVAVLDAFRDLLAGCRTVLDPFAGVGTIHALRPEWETYGIELEKEWATVTDDTVIGDARDVAELYPGRRFDAVATSPAYGNRLADAFYNAHDPEGRRTYAFDLGRPLSPSNGAGMAFGDEYRELHRAVWSSVVAVLEPDGLFVLNCKDFTRAGAVVPVTGWHIGTLAELGLVAVDLRTFPAAGLPYTTAKPMSELVVAFRKAAP